MEYDFRLIGARLKRDIFNYNGAILLPKNSILDKDCLIKLKKHHIFLTENEVEHSSYHIENKHGPKQSILFIQDSIKMVKEVFDLVRSGQQIPLIEIRNHIVPSVQEVTKDPEIFSLILQLQKSSEYTYHHNIAVSVISTMIGEWLSLPPNELALLTLGAILHDIGKTKIPEEILDKPGKLTKDEYQIIKKHTLLGYDLIKNTIGASQRIALIALQHHEREDGKGYPLGITGEKIDNLSKIVAIADVFHAMASDRVYHKAKPFYLVLQEMRDEIFGKLNPKVMSIFLRRIMELLIGNNILLNDGRIGKVIMINPYNPIKPIIELEGNQILDLNTECTVNIKKILTN